MSHSSGSKEGEGGGGGESRGFLHGGGRGGLNPKTKAPVVAGVCGSRWVTGRPRTPNPPSVSCLLLFLSSIHLSFQWRGRSKRNNGLLLPPLSSQQWVCILNRGHGEPRGFLSLFHAFTSLFPFKIHLLLLPTIPSFCLRLVRSDTNPPALFFLSESATLNVFR